MSIFLLLKQLLQALVCTWIYFVVANLIGKILSPVVCLFECSPCLPLIFTCCTHPLDQISSRVVCPFECCLVLLPIHLCPLIFLSGSPCRYCVHLSGLLVCSLTHFAVANLIVKMFSRGFCPFELCPHLSPLPPVFGFNAPLIFFARSPRV